MFYEYEKKKCDYEWAMREMHTHSHYELYILLEGTRIFFIDNTLFTVKPYTAILIPPFIPHKSEGGPFLRVNINFDSDYFDTEKQSLFNQYLLDKRIIIPENNRPTLTYMIKQIEDNITDNDKEKRIFVYCTTCALFAMLCDCVTKSYSENFSNMNIQKKCPPILLKIIAYVNNNINSDLSLPHISKQFFISESYTSKIFRKYMNISISRYILNLRLTNAKKLLTETHKSIEEISSLCGFSSANYFSLIFKQNSGLSPLNFRKHQNNKQFL